MAQGEFPTSLGIVTSVETYPAFGSNRLPQMENNLNNQLLDSVPDGVFTVDAGWRITSFNRAAERITGIKRGEAMGRLCCEVFRANICESSCALKRTLTTHHSISNKVVYIVNARGERIPISISTAPLKDARGQVIGGVETFRDLRLLNELRHEAEQQDSFSNIIGRSKAMRELFELLPTVAESDSTVLLEGASGTGKEVFARAIHELSHRKKKRFVALNCGALPDTLLESELFGYKAGAFTDARKDKPGRFALAEGGTLFLDEIGDISPAMQTRLLRVLQERTYEPLGGIEPLCADVRVIAATNKSLDMLVSEGKFREDLFYRVNVVRLELPALRDRREDIPLLIDHLVGRFNRMKGRDIVGVSDVVLARLMEYDFPGNVRELENIIEHAFALCRIGVIELNHLPPRLRGGDNGSHPELPSGMTLAEMEKLLIRDALRRSNGNRAAAARELGVDATARYFAR